MSIPRWIRYRQNLKKGGSLVKKKISFEADNLKLISDNNDSQFAVIEVDVARSGDNKNHFNISKEAIKFAVPTVEDKPVLVAVNKDGTDFMGHESFEIPAGVCSKAEVVEKDNELYLRCKAKIWKRYFSDVIEIFKKKGGRTQVSMEAECLDYSEPNNLSSGKIDLFSLAGVTLLGVPEAIVGAEARVLSFSEVLDELERENFEERDGGESMKVDEIRKEETIELSEEIEVEEKMADEEIVDEPVDETDDLDEEVEGEGDTEEDTEEVAEEPEAEEEVEMAEEVEEEAETEIIEEAEEVAEESEEEIDETEEVEEVAFDLIGAIQKICEIGCAEFEGFLAECKAVCSEDEFIVMEKICEFICKCAELEQFQEEVFAERTKAGVAQTLAGIKSKLSKEDFAEISKQAEDVEYADLEAFKLKAQSFAFEHMIESESKEEEDIIRMSAPTEKKTQNIFDKILSR